MYKVKQKYALKHLAIHLAESDQHGRLREILLADQDWMEKRFAVFADYGGYLEDLEVALRGITEPLSSSEVLLLAQVFAARLVVHLQIDSYFEEDIIIMSLEGRESEALSRARLRLYPEIRCRDLLAVHRVLRRRGRVDRVLLLEIRERASTIENDRERSYAFSALGLEWALSKFPQEAIEDFEQTKAALDSLYPGAMERNFVLQVLAVSLAKAGFFPEAIEVVRRFRHEFFCAETLVRLARVSPDQRTARRLLVQSEALAAGLSGEQEVHLLAEIISAFNARAMEVDLNRALSKLRSRAGVGNQSEIFRVKLIVGLAGIGRCEEGEDLLHELEPEWARNAALAALSEAWGARMCLDCAERLVELISDPESRKESLLRLASIYSEVGDSQEARRLLEKAREIHRSKIKPCHPSGSVRGTRLERLAQKGGPDTPPDKAALAAVRLAQAGEMEAARAIVVEVEAAIWPARGESSWEALPALATAYAWLGEPERGRAILYEMARRRNFVAMDHPSLWAEDVREILSAASDCGAFFLAFQLLELLPSNEVLEELAAWASAFERVASGLAGVILEEVARIIAWSK